MNRLYPRVAAVLSAVLLMTLTAGCGGIDSKPTQKQKTLTLLMTNHPWMEAVKPLLPEFEAKTGIKVQLETIIEDQLTSKLTVPLTGEWSTPDVFMYRPLQEGKFFYKNGWLEPLDKRAEDPSVDLKDFSGSALNTAKFGDHLYGMPIVTEAHILYYRKDLLENANIPVPATLEELQAAAKKLHDPKHDVYGFVARGQQSALVTQVSSFLYSEGGDFISGNKATVNSPEAVRAFQTYGKMLKNFAPTDVTKWSWPQAIDWFAQGKAAFYADASSLFQNAVKPDSSKIIDKIGYAPFPAGSKGSRPYNVTSWVLGMNGYSKHKDEAWEFIRWASSKEIVLKTQQKGVPGPRNSVWADPQGTGGFPKELVEALRQSEKTSVGYDRPVVIDVGAARNVVGGIVQAVLKGEDVQQAADKANQALQDIFNKDQGN